MKTFRAEREAPRASAGRRAARRWACRPPTPSSPSPSAWPRGSPTSRSATAIPCVPPCSPATAPAACCRRSSATSNGCRSYTRVWDASGRLGPTRLAEGVDAYLRSTQLPGTAVVISDFLVEPSVYQIALEQLLGRHYDVAALRVIGTEERDPSALPRRVKLHDVETGSERIVELSAADRQRYAVALDEHLTTLKAWCDAHSLRFAAADTAAGLDACLLSELTRAGLLR